MTHPRNAPSELAQRLGRLGERGVGIGPVHLMQVHVVGPQEPQAFFDALAQPRPACVSHEARVGLPESPLGRDNDRCARLADRVAKRCAEESFRTAEAVALRRVEEVDPEIESAANRPRYLGVADRSPVATRLL